MNVQVWSCWPAGGQSNLSQGGPALPTTPLPIVVSPTNPVGSSTGVCQLASLTPSSWFTRATTDGWTYQWVTLASLGIGQGMTSPVGTLTISWQAPTTNKDGTSPVTPLSGYTINQGVSLATPPVQPATLAPVATVSPAVLTYTTPPLTAGTYYYSVQANAADGTESVASNVVFGTVSPPEVPGAPTSVTITATV